MLLQKETLNDLRDKFKLNIYEIKIWTSLLSKGVAAASELAELSGVPRSRCYDVLESLEKKGFIIMKIGKPINYIAVQPEAVLDRVQKNLRAEAEQQVIDVAKLSETDIFRELELLHKTGVKKVDVENVTDSIIGKTSVNKFLKDMMQRAKKNVVIVTNDQGIKNKVRIFKKVKENLARKKISVKLYTNSASSLKELGNINFMPTRHDTRFVSIDNEEIFFVMGDKNPENHSGVWIKSSYFVSAMNELFEKSLK